MQSKRSGLARQPRLTWRAEVSATILLGLPLIIAQLAQTAINVTNTLVLGRLGPVELAASVLGWQLFFVTWILGTGFGFAIMPLVASAASRQDARGVARYAHMGLWISAAYALLVFLPLSNARPIFIALGQDPALSELAAQYTRVLQLSMFPQLAVIVLRSWLGALNRPNIVVVAILAGVLVNLLLNLVLVFGAFGMPALGLQGAALATVVATSAIVMFLWFYASRHHSLRDHGLGHGIRQADVPALLEIFRLGWPIGVTVVAEVGLFSASSFMMGWLGTLELAAHGIVLQLSGLAFMVPLGLSAAATIRVGWAHGRLDRRGVSHAIMAALFIGFGFSCLSALAFILFPEFLMSLYLDLNEAESRAVLPYAVAFITIAAAFQVVDGVQALVNGALRGVKDTRVPMILALLSYWGLGLPAAYGFAFVAGFGGVGIWWGLAVGLAVAAVCLAARFRHQLRQMPESSGA